MAVTEIAAVAFGVAYILLAIREHRACWIAGGISTALYAVVFLDAGLPMQAALQLVYVVMSVYGWFAWRQAGGRRARVRTWPLVAALAALAGVVLATAISAPLAGALRARGAPVADSLGTWASLVRDLAARAAHASTPGSGGSSIDTGLAALFAQPGARG